MTRDTTQERRTSHRLRDFRRDERAAVSLIAVATIFMVLAVAVIVIDAGSILYARRTLQNATDAAALSAAQHLDGAFDAAEDVMRENEYEAGNLTSVEIGVYDKEGETLEQRFSPYGTPYDPSVNAVRVSTTAEAPTYFARIFGASDFSVVSAKATAAIEPSVAFGAGTELARLDVGVVNAILGGLLGTTVSLSLANYQALADTQISALDFMKQLATDLSLSAASTYGDLLNTNVTVGEIIDAAIAVLGKTPGGVETSVALDSLNILVGRIPSGTSIRVGDIIGADYLEERDVGSGSGSASISILNLLAASIGSASTGKTIGVGLNIPGLTTAKLAIGAPMKFAVGPIGTTVHTAQIRLSLSLDTTVLGTGITVPIYIESGGGTAEVTSIPCLPGNIAAIRGTTDGVSATFSTVSDQALVDFSQSPTPGAISIHIAGYSLLSVSGNAAIAAIGPTDMNFSGLGQTQRMSSSNSTTHFISDLGASLNVQPNIPIVSALLSTTIKGLILPLGSALTSALTALGISLGAMDVTLAGAKCTPVLVG